MRKGGENINTLIELSVSRKGFSAFFHVVFVVGRGILAEGCAIKPVFNELTGELKSNGLDGGHSFVSWLSVAKGAVGGRYYLG